MSALASVEDLEKQIDELKDDLAEERRVNDKLRNLLAEFIDDVNANANELSSLAMAAEQALDRL